MGKVHFTPSETLNNITRIGVFMDQYIKRACHH